MSSFDTFLTATAADEVNFNEEVFKYTEFWRHGIFWGVRPARQAPGVSGGAAAP